MKKMRCILAILLSLALLLTAGCAKPTGRPEEDPPEETDGRTEATDPTEPAEPVMDAASLNSLRQGMIGTSQLFAVAYFGYHETIDSDLPVNPYEVMEEYAPGLCGDLPFLLQIPEDQIIGEAGDLFCIIPLDENATVVVSQGIWDERNEEYIYEESIFISESGEPILLLCNNAGWEPDMQLYISGPSGEVIWYPRADDNQCAMSLRNDNGEDLFFDFSPYREMLMMQYRDMKDSEWIMPTAEMLTGSTWKWEGFLKDYREVSYQVTFYAETLSVRWNDGFEAEDYVIHNVPWQVTEEDGYAVLTTDFQGFAGIRRYNLLYHEVYEQLYVGMDVVEEGEPFGWEPCYRFLTKSAVPEPIDMVGTWELTWTEVEGDRNRAEPGQEILEITTDYKGSYRISCTNNEFPEWSYDDKELVVFPFALYSSCENDQWEATVNYQGNGGTGYELTLLPDGTLVLLTSWEMDGAPMISFSWYSRVD